MRFLINENYEDPWKIGLFCMTSSPVKMTSLHPEIGWIARFWVDLFKKQSSLKFDIPAAC